MEGGREGGGGGAGGWWWYEQRIDIGLHLPRKKRFLMVLFSCSCYPYLFNQGSNYVLDSHPDSTTTE